MSPWLYLLIWFALLAAVVWRATVAYRRKRVGFAAAMVVVAGLLAFEGWQRSAVLFDSSDTVQSDDAPRDTPRDPQWQAAPTDSTD